MLLQALVLVTALLIVAASILVETLVAAKAGFHAATAATTETAMVDATAAFVRWTQNRVTTYGASNARAWPAQSAPAADPNVCSPPSGPAGGASPPPCRIASFATWQIRGATAAGYGSIASPPPGVADAQNLAPTVNEQRIAATITVRVTDPTGRTTFADRTREITARIFEAAPYVVVTGSRDIAAEAGSTHSGEGDMAGAVGIGGTITLGLTTPNPHVPSAITDTRIVTSVDCKNRPGYPNSDQVAAQDGEIDYSFHPYGNRDWGFEVPCAPTSGQPSPLPGLRGYIPPTGMIYSTTSSDSDSTVWQTNTERTTSFPY